MGKTKTRQPPPGDDPALTADQKRYLSGPVIFHGKSNNAWAEDCPDWLQHDAIPRARLEQVLLESVDAAASGLATLEEACAYLWSASLDAPLLHDDAAIYVWVAANVIARRRGSDPADVMRVVDPDAVRIVDGRPALRNLSSDQRRQLDHLRREIRRAVVRHAANQAMYRQPRTLHSKSVGGVRGKPHR